MADHLSQSNTKSVIEHEGAGRRGGMHRACERIFTPWFDYADHILEMGLEWEISSAIWKEIRGGEFINVIERPDISNKVRATSLSTTVNA
jgi:hypothetical protein